MNASSTRGSDMLLLPFAPTAQPRESVGVEIEAGLVNPLTGISRPYHGERGVEEFLSLTLEQWHRSPTGIKAVHYADDNLIGLTRGDGAEVGIESGCAIEYGSRPERSLFTLIQTAKRDMHELTAIANGMNLALLSGSMLPFDSERDVHWAPKPRIPLMLEHFAREVGPTSQGWAAMTQITTVQTTIDFVDADDLRRKHRMANVVSPLVAALFVNSPVQAGSLTGALSRRMQIWAEVDPRRVGFFEHSIKCNFSIEDLITWAVKLPLIYRMVDGKVQHAPPHHSFESVMKDGFGDGTYPASADWAAVLNTSWPYVRLRDTLEFRIADGLSQRHWTAAPALWLGLAYDRQACEDAWNLARGYSLDAYVQAVNDIAIRGIDALLDGRPVRPMCRELLDIARDGLWRRVKQRLEPEIVLSYLDPLLEVVESGETFAAQLAKRWKTGWATNPQGYVDAYRYQ